MDKSYKYEGRISVDEDMRFAKAIGIPKRRVVSLGGAAKLLALSPECRNILLQTHHPGRAKVRL